MRRSERISNVPENGNHRSRFIGAMGFSRLVAGLLTDALATLSRLAFGAVIVFAMGLARLMPAIVALSLVRRIC